MKFAPYVIATIAAFCMGVRWHKSSTKRQQDLRELDSGAITLSVTIIQTLNATNRRMSEAEALAVAKAVSHLRRVYPYEHTEEVAMAMETGKFMLIGYAPFAQQLDRLMS